MSDKHWYVAYQVIDEEGEILFTGGEFSDVENSVDAIEIVLQKYGHHGMIRIKEVEHLENPYKKPRRGEHQK